MKSSYPHLGDGLPFVGRVDERRRLAAFWERTRDADGVYLGLLTGEAGVGKSRLLEEVLPSVVSAGGAVVHAKLYPHASAGIAEVVGAAVAGAEIRSRLPARQVEHGAAAAVARLRRLSRLRRTLLVIEDLHLLDADGMHQLESLIRSLAGPIGVLGVARSIEVKGSGVLEEYLVETIHLGGLEPADLRELWNRLFGGDAGADVIAMLQDATCGNGLALRSALRGAVESGALIRGERGEMVAGPMFAEIVRRRAGRIAEGLMLHLTRQEREAAYTLAFLGEVFSREAAREMLPDASPAISRLIDAQVVTTVEQVLTPLSGTPDWTRRYDAHYDVDHPASGFPLLSFTHSLLHRELLQEGAPSWGRLARMLALDVPVYSLVPLQYLRSMAQASDVDPNDLRRVVYRACSVAHELNEGTAWRTGLELADAAADVVRMRPGLLREKRDPIEAEVLYTRVSLRRRSFTSDEYRALYERLEQLTRDPDSAPLASYRFALQACRSWQANSPDASGEYRIDCERTLAGFPELSCRREYLAWLKAATADSTTIGPARARELEALLNDFAARPGAAAKYRPDIHQLRGWFIHAYPGSVDLATRLRQLDEMADGLDEENEVIAVARCKLYGFDGWMEQAIDAVEDVIRGMSRRGETGFMFLNFRTMQTICRTGFERERGRLEEEIERLREQFEGREDRTLPMLAMTLVAIGLLRGEPEWIADRLRTLPDGLSARAISPLQAMQLHALHLDGDALRRDFERSPDLVPSDRRTMIESMIDAIEGRHDTELLVRHMEIVDREIERVSDLVYLHAFFAFVDRCLSGAVGDVMPHIGHLPRRALERWLPWLVERGLFALVHLLVDRYGEYLGAGADDWRVRAEVLERAWCARHAKQTDGEIEISLLDTVTFRKPGGEAEPLRGTRMRILVGLMVAGTMIQTRLSHAEFCELIAGDDAALEHPRKVMNLAVFRLREILGVDVILTDAETPCLNPERVRVDLLDADALLRRAMRSRRDGDLARALPAVVEALEIIGTRTPFPSLYDRFFEAMREDFESRLRSVVIGVAEMALAEGDAIGAERVLMLAATSLSGDEEIGQMLRDVLTALDRRAEAELIARRAS